MHDRDVEAALARFRRSVQEEEAAEPRSIDEYVDSWSLDPVVMRVIRERNARGLEIVEAAPKYL